MIFIDWTSIFISSSKLQWLIEKSLVKLILPNISLSFDKQSWSNEHKERVQIKDSLNRHQQRALRQVSGKPEILEDQRLWNNHKDTSIFCHIQVPMLSRDGAHQ